MVTVVIGVRVCVRVVIDIDESIAVVTATVLGDRAVLCALRVVAWEVT